MKTGIIVVAAIVLIGGGAFFVVHSNSNKQSNSTSKTSGSTVNDQSASADQSATPTTGENSTAGTQSGSPITFNISANDTSASPGIVTVKKGSKVTINFNVSAQGTYHHGLDFKNAELGIDSGAIAAGDSGTVTFTASKSFKLTPYWYQSDIKKDYEISVNVE